MAATMLARNPQVVGMSSPTWEQDPSHLMTHLSPNPYEVRYTEHLLSHLTEMPSHFTFSVFGLLT